MRRKTKIKPWVKTFFFLVVIGLLSGLLYFKVFNNGSEKGKSNGKANNNNNNKEVKETKKVYKLSMIMAGDALIHSNVYRDAQNSDGTFNFDKQLRFVKDYINQFDLRYYNQETILGGDNRGYSGYPRFNTPSAFGDTMVNNIGFNIVSLANNHAMDQGETGILNSVNYWKNKNVVWNGQAESEETRNNYVIGEKNNISYAMLSYTEHTNGLPLPSGKSYLVNVWDDDKVKADIEALKGKVDVIIVAVHWGEEYTHTPTNSERQKAQFLADLGVDIVIGCHPHVVQPIEKINNTIVYYSLGNFISNQIEDYKRIGLFGTLDITKTVENGESKITIDNVGGTLNFTWRNTSTYSGHIVMTFSDPQVANYLKDYKSYYTKMKNIVTGGNEEFKITPLFDEQESTEE
ncbi:MAG: CapA family protein [Bacilli bacterium]|nr:CapA family protein [Bacilli bacterium]